MFLKKFLDEIDYFLVFRFFACILVIRQHVAFPYPTNPFGWIFTGTNSSGGYAVVSFIVLSGYLMGKIFQTKKYTLSRQGISQFYWNRFKRIAPVYYFLLIFYIWFVFPYLIRPSQFMLYKNYLIQLLTFNYFGGLPYFNQVIWAISLEVQYYLITPIIVLILWILSKSKILFFAVSITTIYALTQITKITDITFFTFLPSFITGQLLGFVIPYIPKIPKFRTQKFRVMGFLIGILTLMYPWIMLDDWLLSHNLNYYTIITLSTILFILSIELSGGSKLIKMAKNYLASTMNYLGKLTYVIFLSHMLFVTRFNEGLRRYVFEYTNSEIKTGLIVLFCSMLTSIVFSIFIYHSVEVSGGNSLEKIKNYIFRKIKQT
jgi:peptidoglycan/LPS O-acetylase OafA/YrhL